MTEPAGQSGSIEIDASGRLDRHDFGVKADWAHEVAGLLVGREVELSLRVVAVRDTNGGAG